MLFHCFYTCRGTIVQQFLLQNKYFTLVIVMFMTVHPTAEPEEVSLKVDGETDQCSRAEDINFEIVGFSIYGQVRGGLGTVNEAP